MPKQGKERGWPHLIDLKGNPSAPGSCSAPSPARDPGSPGKYDAHRSRRDERWRWLSLKR